MSSNNTVICEEIFDESSHPSIDEIRDYANKIGIDPESEPHLLSLATEGLMKALPPGWKPCFDEKTKSYYYYNNLTHKTQWEHPLDDIYRGLVKKKRTESQSLSIGEPNEDATYTRDDLPSLEEPINFNISPMSPKQLEPISLSVKKKEMLTSPLNPPLAGEVNKLFKQKSEEKPDIPKKLTMFSSFDASADAKGTLKLSGGGSMFLKSNTTKKPNEEEPSKPQVESNNHPRGILRERSFIENSKSSVEADKSTADRSDKDDDDRKSVRFNFDTNPDITFDFNNKELDNAFIDVKLTPKPKSRFSISPVKDLLTKFNDKSDEPNNMRLIKPNPKDFYKPKLRNPLESDNTTNISDSEDDSMLKSIEMMDRKSSSYKEKMDKSESIQESDNSITSPEYVKTNRAQVLRQIREDAEKDMAHKKKKIWEDMNDEIYQYKENIQESQKSEMERILQEEKEIHGEKIKTELTKLRLELESSGTCVLEDEKDKIAGIKSDIDSKYKQQENELEEYYKKQLDSKKSELEKRFKEQLESFERDMRERLDKTKDELVVSHKAITDQLRKNHEAILDELKKDLKSEEQIIRKEYHSQIQDLKKKVSVELDQPQSNSSRHDGDERLYEKVRCEKRLLEDKYRCLKDKYLRLKTEVKMSIEKRNRRREQSTTNTTGSETERSNSVNKERSPTHKPPLVANKRLPPHPPDINSNRPPNIDHPKPAVKQQISVQDLDTSVSDHSYQHNPHDDRNNQSSDDNLQQPGRSRKKLFSRLKSSSTSRLHCERLHFGNNNNKSRTGNGSKNGQQQLQPQQRSCSPVENLRRQLQKLEDLEDEFPAVSHDAAEATYHLRYPFTEDGQQKSDAGGSSELEFFRHRIHLERDSIKRAKESLRTQKCLFQQRQNDLKLKHGSMARHTLQQLCQEEKDLTDMEVSLHRTRSLLGEKVIRLRHLEQSLQRAATAVTGDHPPAASSYHHLSQHLLRGVGLGDDVTTLSDLSSHSASSGISSTEFATAAATEAALATAGNGSGCSSGGGGGVTRGGEVLLRGEHLQESSEIIQSLENLNAEIREIWDVLNKQQHQTTNMAMPPLPLVFPADLNSLNWPMLAAAAAATATAPPPAPPSIPTLADRLHNYRQQVALANAQSTVVTSYGTQQGGGGATTTTTTLVERTRNLRQWLRHAGGIDSGSVDGVTPQATL